MNMQEIRKIAKKNGLKISRLNKTSLVKKIQSSEGNYDCFATATNNYCDQANCLWQADCLKMAPKVALAS